MTINLIFEVLKYELIIMLGILYIFKFFNIYIYIC